ncbi:MAG: hypothetical protein HZA53_05030, partial [Planctomycetes bacterium]|nr:hypothetical protein [Planctomycetota bacterium]
RWIFFGALLLLGASLYLPAARVLFGFDPVRPGELVLAFGASLGALAWFEFVKRGVARRA